VLLVTELLGPISSITTIRESELIVKEWAIGGRTFFCIRITLVHFFTRRPLLFCPRSGWKSVYKVSAFPTFGDYP